MNAIFEEILSDYLDERLTPEERIEIERRLALEPELRSACDALRAVRHAVQELPTVEPTTDWTESVVHRAAGREGLQPAVDQVRPAHTVLPVGSPASRSGPSSPWRFWALAAVAGTLLIGVVWLRPKSSDRRLAEEAQPSRVFSEPGRELATAENATVAAAPQPEATKPATETLLDRTASRDAATPVGDSGAAGGLVFGKRSRPAMLDRDRIGDEPVTIRVALPTRTVQIALNNQQIRIDSLGKARSNDVRRSPVAEDRSSVAEDKVLSSRAADVGGETSYVVEATLEQLNAALLELAAQGSVRVEYELAKNAPKNKNAPKKESPARPAQRISSTNRSRSATGTERIARSSRTAKPAPAGASEDAAVASERLREGGRQQQPDASPRPADSGPRRLRVLLILDPPVPEND